MLVLVDEARRGTTHLMVTMMTMLTMCDFVDDPIAQRESVATMTD